MKALLILILTYWYSNFPMIYPNPDQPRILI